MYREEDFNLDEQEATIFKENYQRQAKMAKKIFLFVFTIFGLIFLTIGLVLLWIKVQEGDFLVGIPFTIIGGVFTVLGLVLGLALPSGENFDYAKFKAKMNRHGGFYIAGNTTYLSTIVMVQKEQIKNLTQRVKYLEEDVRRLKYERK